MKMNIRKSILLSFLFTTVFLSCTKENIKEPPVEDNINGRTIRYTVQIVAAGNTTFKSFNMIDSAIVSLVMNDSIYSVATDKNGIATFNNLFSGTVQVNVKYDNYTPVNLIVDLTTSKDSIYDANNLRNAATMIALFPLSGNGTATIKGKAFAELNTTIAGLEVAPVNIQVSSIIESEQLTHFTNHTGSGKILSVSYEQSINYTQLNSNSEYQITVPAAGSGLKILIKANDFVYNQITGTGTQRTIYKDDIDTISVISGFSYFNDIIY